MPDWYPTPAVESIPFPRKPESIRDLDLDALEDDTYTAELPAVVVSEARKYLKDIDSVIMQREEARQRANLARSAAWAVEWAQEVALRLEVLE